MCEFRLPYPASVIAGKVRLSSDDLSTLRSLLFPHGLRTCDDAITILALNTSCPDKCNEWRGFFLQAMTDFVVHASYPRGALDDINIAWLVRMLSSQGVVWSTLELELVLSVIGASSNVPPELSVFALEQLRVALSDGVGAYWASRPINRQGITGHDLTFIRRVLRTAVDDGQLALASEEIDILEQIDRATVARENHPDWARLMRTVRPRSGDDSAGWRWLRVPNELFSEEAA